MTKKYDKPYKRYTKPKPLLRDLVAQRKRGNAERVVQAHLHKVIRDTGRRPGRGTGICGDDLWQPTARTGAYVPDDDRQGKMFCKACGEEVTHVEVEGKWHTRNPDNLPHILTCTGDE